MLIDIKTTRRFAVTAAVAMMLLCIAHAGAVPEAQVDAVVAYVSENIDDTTGLVKDSTGQPNLAETSPGAVAALMLDGDTEQARAIIGAIVDHQDTGPESKTYGQFTWYDKKPYSYDATLYALPPLSWVLTHHGDDLGEMRGPLAESLSAGLAAIERETVESQSEAYSLLQAACRASVGRALSDDEKVQAAQKQVKKWLQMVTESGLPAGHSQTFDALRVACLNWVKWAGSENNDTVDAALHLALADVGERLWTPGPMIAGAPWRAYAADYIAKGGVSQYLLPMFGMGTFEGAEPFSMFITLPGCEQVAEPRDLSEGPWQVDTRGTSGPVAATSTYLAPQFTLGTFSGTLTGSSVPVLMQFPTGTPTAYSWAHPAPASVASVQSGPQAVCTFDFDQIGGGTRRQAFVRLMLGKQEDIEAVSVHGGLWNNEPTGIAQRESLALQMHDCYVGIVLGRRGPIDKDIERRVKPGSLEWVEGRPLSRLMLTIYGRQGDTNLARRFNNVRVTFAVVVTPDSEYETLADFARHLATTSVTQTVEKDTVTIEDTRQESESPFGDGGIIPKPKSKSIARTRTRIKHTVRFKLPATTLEVVEDMATGEVISRSVDGEEVSSEYLWSSPGFQYAPGEQLPPAVSSAGL